MKYVLALALLVFAANVYAATPTQTVTVKLTWTDNSANEDGFNIYQCVGSGCVPTSKIPGVATNVTTYTDTITGDPGQRVICYAVSAFNTAGESAKTPTACITTPAIIVIPGAPSGPIAVILGVSIP